MKQRSIVITRGSKSKKIFTGFGNCITKDFNFHCSMIGYDGNTHSFVWFCCWKEACAGILVSRNILCFFFFVFARQFLLVSFACSFMLFDGFVRKLALSYNENMIIIPFPSLPRDGCGFCRCCCCFLCHFMTSKIHHHDRNVHDKQDISSWPQWSYYS